MKRNILVVFIVCVVLIGASPPKQNKVCINGSCFFVELARTPQERRSGLMFRNDLDKNQGMLFLFEDEVKHGFWMKDTYIPLDIIWISSNNEVIFIKENVQPCNDSECMTIMPDKKALYALEVNAGIVEDCDLKIGDKVVFDIK